MIDPGENMEVVYVDSISASMNEWRRNRFFPLGGSSFQAPLQSASSLVRFGTGLGATHATYERKYLRTNSGVMPLTMTTPTTSYSSGSIYTPSGTASYSGTTYGTQTTTTMMPYSIDRYSHNIIYWAPFVGTPATGVIPSDLSSEDTVRFNRNTGALVDVVVKETPAFYANILPGDLIIQIDETLMSSAQDYADFVSSNRGKEVIILLLRNGETQEVRLRINEEISVAPSDELCCQHPHHLECIVNTASAPPGSCQHSHHLECGVTTTK